MFHFVAFLALASLPAATKDFTLDRATEGQRVVRRAIDAHGGEEAITSLAILHELVEGSEYDTDQGIRPSSAVAMPLGFDIWTDFNSSRLSFNVKTSYPGGFDFQWRRVLPEKEKGWLISELTRQRLPLPPRAHDRVWSRAEQYSVPMLLRRMTSQSDQALSLGSTMEGTTKLEVISFPARGSGSLMLFFDADSGLLRRYETLNEDALRGRWTSSFRYDNFADFARVKLPASIRHFRQNDLLEDLRVTRETPAAFEGSLLAPHDDYPPLTWPERLEQISSSAWLLSGLGGGFYNTLLVDLGDSVAVVDVPLDPDTAHHVLGRFREVSGNKPIAFAIYSHHHLDHSGSVKALAAAGAEIITTTGNHEMFEVLAGDTKPRFRFVSDRLSLGAGAKKVEVHRLRKGPHVDEMLLVSVPGDKLVFDGDLFSLLVPPNETTAFFLSELKRLRIRPAIVAGVHHPPLTLADIEKTVSEEPR